MNEPALHALYAASDVCMVAPIRDGLDLVSYEYVASQRQTANCGVLMLSKYTGASRMLESALTIDPWDTPRFSEDIARALAMTEEERNQRMESARKVVEEWTR